MNDFLERLKERKLVQWALAYVAASFAALQGIDIVASRFGWPETIERALILGLAVGFFVTLVVAWYHGEKGAQRVTGTELLILALLLAIGGGALWRMAPAPHETDGAVHASAANDKSLAVLPLVNSGGDQSNEYFSDGLSEELISVLAKVPGLKIIGRSSSFHFKNSSDDSRTIGAKLGVAKLLEGSVRRQGERVRISVDLINAADASELWSESYDRDLKDIFGVQREIATAVTDQLRIKWLGEGPAAGANPGSINIDAHNALLQGDFYANRATEADFRRSIDFYTQAVHLDPDYALAHARLAYAYTLLNAGFLGGAEAAENFAKARVEAKTALRLAPDLAEAHVALGSLLNLADFDVAGGEREYRRALELAPADGAVKARLGVLLGSRGRLQEAAALNHEAIEDDPFQTVGYIQYARVLIALDRLDEAEATLRKALEQQPGAARLHATFAVIDLVRGKNVEALAEAKAEPPGFWSDFAVTLALQRQGDKAAADNALQEFSAKHADNGPFQVAVVHALREEPDQVFEWLDHALASRDVGVYLLYSDPFLRKYHDDPRFAAFHQKMDPTFANP